MENQITLQPCRLTPEDLGSPLPFDLYNGKGTLLVKKGTCLREGAEELGAPYPGRSQRDLLGFHQQRFAPGDAQPRVTGAGTLTPTGALEEHWAWGESSPVITAISAVSESSFASSAAWPRFRSTKTMTACGPANRSRAAGGRCRSPSARA